MFRLPAKIITPTGAVASISWSNTLFLPLFALTLCLVQPCAASPGEWEYAGSLGTARGSHTATLLPNGKVLVAAGSGRNGAYLSSAELYDPASGSWSSTGSLGTGRLFATATLLPSGKMLLAAGLGRSGLLSSAE